MTDIQVSGMKKQVISKRKWVRFLDSGKLLWKREQFIELLQQMNKILIALLPKLGKALKGR